MRRQEVGETQEESKESNCLRRVGQSQRKKHRVCEIGSSPLPDTANFEFLNLDESFYPRPRCADHAARSEELASPRR